MRARLGMYFYIGVALVSLLLFVLQLALRYPGYLSFQVSDPLTSTLSLALALTLSHPSPSPQP